MHPQSKHWHLIDYILVHKRDFKGFIHTKVMPSAECHTNYCLVHSKLRLHLNPNQEREVPPKKKFNLNKLLSSGVKADFLAGLQSKLEKSDCPEDTSPETLWDQLKSAILQISEEVLGFTTKKNKDWFDENNQEIQELLVKKRSSHLAQLSCPLRRVDFYLICSILQRKLWKIQNEWWTNLAERTQQYAKLGDYKSSYKALKVVHGSTHQVQSLLRSMDGQVFLQTRLPFWVTSNPSLALTVSSRTQQFSTSPSNHSKQDEMKYPLWKKLPNS